MHNESMVPIGYLLKTVVSPAPEWMQMPDVAAIHSLSNCTSKDFCDYIPLWEHNGWWLFDTAEAVIDTASKQGVSLDHLTLFYYECFDHQYDDQTNCWNRIEPESSFKTNVVRPTSAKLSGFDVVTFYVGTSPECSPLSCNGLAAEISVNDRCLFESFGGAYAAIENGSFRDSEPGPYRIVAVYLVDP
jgi:hypothetical protein